VTHPAQAADLPSLAGAAPDAGDVARLREMVENTPDIIARFDRGLRHIYVNRAVEGATGFTVGALIGRTNAEVGMPAPLVAMWEARLNRVFEGGAEETFEFEYPSPDGPRHFHARVVPEFALGAADGAPASVLAVLRDVTDRVRLEEQLRQAQKMEAVGRLAGGVAHDFNNLLTVISTYCQFLLDDIGAGDSRRADVTEICKAADRAAQLTRQLLAFSRQQVLQPRVVDVNEVVSGMEAMVARLVGEDVEIVTRLGADLPMVLADPSQLEQVVMNLAVNARDAMPDGGVLIMTTEHSPDGGVRLGVRDTGSGMDAATRTRAVEPFFTTKPKGAGTGLGLSTVHGIVEQSGGRLTIESTIGRGTEVAVHLPAAAPDAGGPAAAASAASEAAGGTETVLVVEDEDAVRAAVRRALEARGYRVLDAHDGTEGIATAGRFPGTIHLLLTDVVMPAMDGREVARRLAAERPGLRVMYMSGYSEGQTAERVSLGTGAVLLQKPFTLAELSHAVRMVLDAE
jgi:PAS domain S-box-containing protein